MTVHLTPVTAALVAATTRARDVVDARLRSLDIEGDVDVEVFGTSAFIGALSRGDIDLLGRVPADRFDNVCAQLREAADFDVAQPENWTVTFASFTHHLDTTSIGLQLVAAGSADDVALHAQQQALADPAVRAAYDAAKAFAVGRAANDTTDASSAPEGLDAQGYWRVKDLFWRTRPGASSTPLRWARPSTPVWKILTTAQWEQLLATDHVDVDVDIQDGFVHLSTPTQARETVARHFTAHDPATLWLLALDVDALGEALRFEPSRGGALFPHLYRALGRDDIWLARPWR